MSGIRLEEKTEVSFGGHLSGWGKCFSDCGLFGDCLNNNSCDCALLQGHILASERTGHNSVSDHL